MKRSILKFGRRLLWARLTGKKYPFLVQFSVTNRCNARCKHCYATYYARPSDDMPLKDVRRVVDELARAGTFRLNLVGGEPLLRDDIGDIIEYVRGKGIDCAMTTNGTLVPGKIGLLKDLQTVCISIDGERRHNDQVRGEGAFDRAVAGLDACRDAGVPTQLSAVLTKYTVHDVDFMVELAESYGCRVGFATLIGRHGRGGESGADLCPSEEDVRKALARIVEHKHCRKPVLFSAGSYELALAWPDYGKEFSLDRLPGVAPIQCYAGRYYCLVDYNGDVYPCPQLVGIVKHGNILRDGLESAMDKAVSHNCTACAMPCSSDFNLFFGLRIGSLMEHFRSYGKR